MKGGGTRPQVVSVQLVLGVALLGWIFLVPDEIQRQYSLPKLAVLLLVLTGLVLLNRSARFLFRREHRSLWVFVLALLASVTCALDKPLAFQTSVTVAVSLLCFYFIAHELFSSGRQLQRGLIVTICILSTAISLIAVVEWWLGGNIIYDHWVEGYYYERYMKLGVARRPLSTQSNPAVLGTFMVGCLPFGLYLAGRSWGRLRVLGVVSLGLNLVTIALASSRGAFLATVAALGFYSWHRDKRWTLALLAGMSMLVWGLDSDHLRTIIGHHRFSFEVLVYGRDTSIVSPYRLLRLETSIRAAASCPPFGVGMNNLRARFYEFYPRKHHMVREEKRVLDNMYLTLLAETGLVGLGGFCMFIGVLLRRGFHVFRRAPPGEMRAQALMFLTALVGLLVNMGSYDLFYWPNPLALFSVVCGMLVALSASVVASHSDVNQGSIQPT